MFPTHHTEDHLGVVYLGVLDHEVVDFDFLFACEHGIFMCYLGQSLRAGFFGFGDVFFGDLAPICYDEIIVAICGRFKPAVGELALVYLLEYVFVV